MRGPRPPAQGDTIQIILRSFQIFGDFRLKYSSWREINPYTRCATTNMATTPRACDRSARAHLAQDHSARVRPSGTRPSAATPSCAVTVVQSCAATVVPTCALIACQIGGNKAVSGQAFKSGQALSHAIRNPQSRAMAGTSGRRLSGTGEGGVSDLQDRRRKGEVRRRSKRSVACPLQATSSMARRRRHQHGGRGSGARERTSPSRLRWRPVFLATSLLALLLCSSAARARRRGIPPAGGGCAGTGRDGR